MNISVIICTHNRANLLRDALMSFKCMNMPAGCHVELLVVNNASNDNTPLVINKFSSSNEKFSVKSLSEPRLGKTYALNRAINNAYGEILSFIDDDHIVHEDYLIAVCRAVKEKPDYSLYCGRILPNWDGTEPKWVHDTTEYPIRPFLFPYYDYGDTIMEIKREDGFFLPPGGNLIVRKPIFQKIGFFSEYLGPKGHNLQGGEDIDFIERALKSGERLLYIPDAMQYHQVDKSRLTLPYLMQKAYYRSIAAYTSSKTDAKYFFIGNIPAYLFRQALSRFIRAMFAKNQNARRFYMVRLAATLGEIQARRKSKS